jgi:hypothetical protein
MIQPNARSLQVNPDLPHSNQESFMKRWYRPAFDVLESRLVLSFSFGMPIGDVHDHHDHDEDEVLISAEAGGGKAGPAIRLDLVTLHELGHALGLDHTSDSSSIMYAYYNANYNLNNFSNDSAVQTFRSIYSNVSTSPWKDSLDPSPGNGRVDITYSWMPDGSKAENNKTTNLFSAFNAIFGSTSAWQGIITGELNRWAGASNNKVSFLARSDNGLAFNYVGSAQNDSRSGDIRIAAHRFDGAGKVLAHTYFPPPNGSTAAGDMHFDYAENWVLASGGSTDGGGGGGGNGGGGGAGNLTLGGPAATVEAAVVQTLVKAAPTPATTDTLFHAAAAVVKVLPTVPDHLLVEVVGVETASQPIAGVAVNTAPVEQPPSPALAALGMLSNLAPVWTLPV